MNCSFNAACSSLPLRGGSTNCFEKSTSMDFLTVQRESHIGEGENWKLSCVVVLKAMNPSERFRHRERMLTSYGCPKRQEAC